MPSTFLGTGDMVVNKSYVVHAFKECMCWWGEAGNKYKYIP